MSQSRFEEYFAKVVLESCFPKRFINLQVADKPDLRCGNEIGIEVTNCMPKEAAEALNLWQEFEKLGEKTPPRILERLEQLKDTVHLVGNELIWEQGSYKDDDIENSPIKDFFNSVKKKVNRLNSRNADYAKMDKYELFVNSAILIPRFYRQEIIPRLQDINNEPRKFDRIYLLTNEKNLHIFDMVNNNMSIKTLDWYLDRMAKQAYEIYQREIK